MSQGIAPEGESECGVCGNTHYELSDGLFFCSECGTQSQDVREEIAEETEHVSGVRTYKGSTAKKKGARQEDSHSKDISFLEKVQAILRLQCDALIGLGFDPSVKEAVKCISLLYLKHFGYAFQDRPMVTLVTPTSLTRSVPLRHEQRGASSTVSFTETTPIHKRCPGGRKRLRLSDDVADSVPSPKRFQSYTDQAGHTHPKEEKNTEQFSDSFLFKEDDSSDDNTSSGEDEDPGVGARLKKKKPLFGDDVHLFFKSNDPRKVRYFTIRFTISLLYLGLLFTNQNVLLCDLVRLITMNKIPYHNLHMVLPSQYLGSRSDVLRLYGRVTADKLHQWSLSLYKSLPLPLLPIVDPQTICHTLCDRLVLPTCFHGMVDSALTEVYSPTYHKEVGSYTHRYSAKEKRLDVECLALIVVLLKLVYRLDDTFEFEQSSRAVSCPESEGQWVYLWEDWVTVLCRQMQDRLEESIPLTARELSYVDDHQNYLDFCRQEIFPKVRPVRTSGERHRLYNPQHFAKVSSVFGQHLKNLRAKDAKKNSQDADIYNWNTFTPRWILLLFDKDDASGSEGPWSKYLATPGPTTSTNPCDRLDSVSKSMRFVLQLCADVIDVEVRRLLQWVCQVEWTIIRTHKISGPLSLHPSSPSD